MTDFVNINGLRQPRLADLSQYVDDAFILRLAPEETYQPGRVALDAFEFMPYALSGMSASLADVQGGAVRSTGKVQVPIFDDTGRTDTAERDLTVLGPGDVLGIDRAQIVRRFPTPGSTTAEDTFLAHIEFDRPELPWAFSAQQRRARMTPWLALVVLEAAYANFAPGVGGRPQLVSTRLDQLQPLVDTWAWAHVQVHATAGPTAVQLSTRLSTAYGPTNLSRLICPRALSQDTAYVACLVPATEVGALVGRGLPGGGLGPAWGGGAPDQQVVLPVYDSWQFRTGPDGDFASLARRLHGVAAPWSVGRRILDTAVPGSPLTPLAAGEQGRRQVLRCALYSPASPPPDAPPDVGWSADRTTALRTALDQAAALSGSDPLAPGQSIPDLPIVGPRIYARYARGAETVGGATDWFADLNVHPAARVTAGLGTRVVVKDQEPLMQSAWAQVGEIDAANRNLMLAQFARHVAASMHTRLSLVDEGRLLQISRPLHERVTLAGNNLTLATQTALSATAPAALSGAFRRSVRPTGPLGARLAPAERGTLTSVVGAAEGGFRDFTRSYSEPDGVRTLSASALATLGPDAAAAALGSAPDQAALRLSAAVNQFNGGPALATFLTTPASWSAADPNFNLTTMAAQHMTDVLNARVPQDPAANPVAARSVGGLLAGLASSQLAGTEAARATASRMLDTVQQASAGIPAGGAVIPATPSGAGLPAGGVVIFEGPGGAAGGVLAGGMPAGGGVATPVVMHGLVAQPSAQDLHTAGLMPAATRDMQVSGMSTTTNGRVVGPIVRPGTVSAGLNPNHVPIGVLVSGGQVVGVGGVVTPGAAAVSADARLTAFTSNEGHQLSARLATSTQVGVDAVRSALLTLVTDSGALSLSQTPPRPTLVAPKTAILTRLDPGRTVVEAVRGRLGKPAWLPADWFDDTLIRPIMAAPHFDRPMFQGLDDYNRSWLVPGLGLLPPDDLVSVLQTNDEFVEAFLVGLSDEMGRTLLWRGYPADARGTYFRRFWDAAHDELQTPIHRFGGGALGSHVGVGPVHTSGRVVVLVRGEIVRRYPDMIVQALRQVGTDPDRPDRPLLPETGDDQAHSAELLFTAFLSPDVMLVGFDVTVTQVKADGDWWFVIAEHPSATHFDRDLQGSGVTIGFAGSAGSADGGTVAHDRLHSPTRVAFASDDFLPPPPP